MARPVEPWAVSEPELDLAGRWRAASVLALSNGWIGVRGALDELAPDVGPATLLAALHDDVPLSYAEPAYGYPTSSEHLVPAPDGWAVQLLVDGAALDVRGGAATRHERRLDVRRAVLEREVAWTAPSGAAVEVSSRRLVSLARRDLVVTRYEVRARTATRVELRPFPCCAQSPGASAHVAPPDRPGLLREACGHTGEASWTTHRAARSGVRVAVRGEHRVEAADGVRVERSGGSHTTSLAADLAPGQWLRLTLPVAYAPGPRTTSSSDLLDRCAAVLDDVRELGWDDLLAEHAAVLADVWRHGDVEVVGDDEMQQALRFAVLQTVQSAAGCADVGIRAKGLTGTGYDGHTFWDADTFVTPVLNHLLPDAAAAHLRWRHATLPGARERAAELGLAGAAFPWRTVTGRESAGYWPAGTAAVHVTADVADAALRHAVATRDVRFTREVALAIAVEAARFFVALGRYDDAGGFHLDGVTGPDEYSALMDDNAFTNLMARRVLRAAAELAEAFGDGAAGTTPAERASWERAADAVVVPVDADRGVTQQARGFTDLAVWDLDGARPEDYPLHTSAHYSALYRHQVLKQCDVVMAAHLVDDAFTTEQKRRDLEYYEPLTVRDSSLSAPSQAVVAAEVGHLDLAWAYARETALVDLRDNGRPTEDGIHVAAHAGAWTALVAGFGGLRESDGGLHLRPVLPPALTRLAFGLRRGGSVLRVELEDGVATYRLVEGGEVELTHDGEALRLTPSSPEARRPMAPRPAPGPAPRQPRGREPSA